MSRIDELVNLIKECHRIYKESCETCTQYSGKCGAYWELRYLITIEQRKVDMIKSDVMTKAGETANSVINEMLEKDRVSMERVIADLLQGKEEEWTQ